MFASISQVQTWNKSDENFFVFLRIDMFIGFASCRDGNKRKGLDGIWDCLWGYGRILQAGNHDRWDIW